jgi:hypothetical protein
MHWKRPVLAFVLALTSADALTQSAAAGIPRIGVLGVTSPAGYARQIDAGSSPTCDG